MKSKTEFKRPTIAIIAALQFTLPASAADGSNAPADSSPNPSTSQAAEIDALKKEVQDLAQKVNALENQQAAKLSTQSSATVDALYQKVRALERERESDEKDSAASAKTQPKISLNENGFSFSSANSNFVATLHGVLQLDSRIFFGNPTLAEGDDGFLLRKARPIFSGTVFHDFDFAFRPDLGGSSVQIVEAYVNYRCNSDLQLEAGKFKSPVGLEQLQLDAWTLFNERSIANDLVPNRDLGVELHGDFAGGILSYAAGVFNGAPDYNGTTFNSPLDNGKAFAGRVFARPFRTATITWLQGVGVGVGGSYENDHDGASGLTGGYTTDGQEKFFTYASTATADGPHWRISPQSYYYYGPLSLMGEYMVSDQRILNSAEIYNVQNTAWEISAGWILTGEDAGSNGVLPNGVTPLHPFNLHSGDWGAWQLVARYANLDVDDDVFKDDLANSATSASEARAWSVGVNWFLNQDIRVNASFSHTDFTGGTGVGATVTRQPENVLFTRVQLAF